MNSPSEFDTVAARFEAIRADSDRTPDALVPRSIMRAIAAGLSRAPTLRRTNPLKSRQQRDLWGRLADEATAGSGNLPTRSLRGLRHMATRSSRKGSIWRLPKYSGTSSSEIGRRPFWSAYALHTSLHRMHVTTRTQTHPSDTHR